MIAVALSDFRPSSAAFIFSKYICVTFGPNTLDANDVTYIHHLSHM